MTEMFTPTAVHAEAAMSYTEAAAYVLEAWGKAVTGIVETGERLAELKGGKLFGDWLPFVAEHLPFDESTARRLMSVGRHPVISNRANSHDLPASAFTLAELARLPAAEVETCIADGRISPTTKGAEAMTLVQQYERDNRDADLFDPPDLGTIGTFDVILADPPWRYNHAETERRAIENHYPTMTDAELKGLEIPAADNCALFMWVTSPKVAEAMELLDAWQFEYVTSAVWVKSGHGMGYWFRQNHELLFVARRGKPSPPEPSDRFPSVFTADRQAHSQKPNIVVETIDRMFPTRSKVELFARTSRPGWTVWGNQA